MDSVEKVVINTPTVHELLIEFQSKIKSIKKAGYNPHFKSAFATHEDVFDYMLPILTSVGLSIRQEGKIDGEWFSLVTTVSNKWGEKIESTWPVIKEPSKAQDRCAATTYISRHAAMRLLGLSAHGDDRDGEVEETEQAPTYPEERPVKNHAPQPQASIEEMHQRLRNLVIQKDVKEEAFNKAVTRVLGHTVSVSSMTFEELEKLCKYISVFKTKPAKTP